MSPSPHSAQHIPHGLLYLASSRTASDPRGFGTRAVHLHHPIEPEPFVFLLVFLCRRREVVDVLLRLVVHELALVLFRALLAEGHHLGRVRV